MFPRCPPGTLTYTVTLASNPGTPLTATATLKIGSQRLRRHGSIKARITSPPAKSAGFTVTNAQGRHDLGLSRRGQTRAAT